MRRLATLAIIVLAIVGATTACQSHDEAIHQDALDQSKLIYGG